MTRAQLALIACGPVLGFLVTLAAFHPLEVLAGCSVVGTAFQVLVSLRRQP